MKNILVNGHTETAFAILKTAEIPSDYSALMKNKHAQATRDVFSIYFKGDWKFTFLLENQPSGTILGLDNIARIDFKLHRQHLACSGNPGLKKRDFERLRDGEPPQFIFDNSLEWSQITLLLPCNNVTKDSVENVILPDKTMVRVRIPKGKTLALEGVRGGRSPVQSTTINEIDAIKHLLPEEHQIAKTISKLNHNIKAILPHAQRGVKTITSASNGGKEISRMRKPLREKIRKELAEFLVKNPYVSLTQARERIAIMNGVSRRSVETYTKGMKK